MYIAKTLLSAVCGLGLILAGPAFGDILSFQITVNTASVSGATGYVDFQLNPGSLGAAGVTASISDFSGVTLSTNTTTTGTVTGTNLYFIAGDVSTSPASSPILLSATNTLNLVNGDSTNELTQALKFTTSATFDVTLSGPGVSVMGDAAGTSGTTFLVDFLNDPQTAYVLTSDTTGSTASGWADLIDISNTGLFTTTPADGGFSVISLTGVTITPEPSSTQLALIGVGLLIFVKGMRTRKSIAACQRF
jgi:hypothetical protein